MKQVKTLIIGMALLLPLISSAQEVKQLSLDQAVEYALNNAADIKNSKLEVENSEQEVKSIISTGLPQIKANANFTHNVQIAALQLPDFISPAVYGVLINEGLLTPDRFQSGAPQTVAFGAPSSLTGMITLDQLVFDGTYFLGLKAAREYVMLNELMKDMTEVTLIENVHKAFYGVLITDRNIKLMESSMTQINKTYSETEELLKSGFAEQLDLDRLKLTKNNLETRLTNLSLQRDVLLSMLKVTMGMNLNERLTLEGNLENYISLESSIKPASLEDRVEYQILKQQLVMDSMGVKRYKVGYLPTLRLNASYQQNSFADEAEFKGLGKQWNPGTTYGFNMSIPIFDGLYKQAKISQAKIKLEQDQNTMDQTMNGLLFEAEQARLNLTMQDNNVLSTKSSKDLAQSIYETTRIKFREGLVSSFELIQAENDRISAEIEYSNALYERLLSQVQLDKTLGTLNAKK